MLGIREMVMTDLDRASIGELPEASRHRVGPLSPLRAWLMLRRHRVSVSVASALATVLLLGLWLGRSRMQTVVLNTQGEATTWYAVQMSSRRILPVRLAALRPKKAWT